jgi:hypothetical protein
VNDRYLVQAPNAHGGTSLGYARGADPWSAAQAAGAPFADPEKETPVNGRYLVQAPNAHGGTSLGYARGADPWSAARAAGAPFADPERDAQADTEFEAGA